MNKPTKIPATAYILIGGESKRFGSLKWQTTINGQTILDRIWDACNGIGNRYVLGKKKPDSIFYPFIKDVSTIPTADVLQDTPTVFQDHLRMMVAHIIV